MMDFDVRIPVQFEHMEFGMRVESGEGRKLVHA